MRKSSPFRYFKTSPEVIRLAVVLYIRFPLSLRSVEISRRGPESWGIQEMEALGVWRQRITARHPQTL